MEFMAEFFPVTLDMPDVQRKNNLRLLEDMKRRYWDAPDLSNSITGLPSTVRRNRFSS